MYDAKTIFLAKQFKHDLDITRLDAESIALLEIVKNAAGSVPVRDATIENGIATFGGVVASSPLVSLLLNIPITQTGSGTPSPDNIRDFVGVSGVNVTRTGKNLWDEETRNGFYNSTTGAFTSNNAYLANKNPIRVFEQTKYYVCVPTGIKWAGFYYDANNNFLSRTTLFITGSREVTPPENCAYMNFYTDTGYGTTYNNDISINYPSTDTSYHAYNGNTYQITFGQTVYSAILDVLRGKLSITHAYFELDGSENWRLLNPESEITRRFTLNTGVEMISGNADSNYLDYQQGNSGSWGTFCVASSTYILVHDKDSNIASLTAFTNYLNEHHLQVVSKLAEPIEIDLTPTVINTLIGDNVIFADVGDITECKYTRK